jgi:hypothetical protein
MFGSGQDDIGDSASDTAVSIIERVDGDKP